LIKKITNELYIDITRWLMMANIWSSTCILYMSICWVNNTV